MISDVCRPRGERAVSILGPSSWLSLDFARTEGEEEENEGQKWVWTLGCALPAPGLPLWAPKAWNFPWRGGRAPEESLSASRAIDPHQHLAHMTTTICQSRGWGRGQFPYAGPGTMLAADRTSGGSLPSARWKQAPSPQPKPRVSETPLEDTTGHSSGSSMWLEGFLPVSHHLSKSHC